MLARCLYKNSPVLILDEPTSALDPISEYEVFSQFQEMLTGKTGIFISHRMGSCKFCSKIFVLDQGRIIQQGSHEQLMQQPEGLYVRPIWTKPAQQPPYGELLCQLPFIRQCCQDRNRLHDSLSS